MPSSDGACSLLRVVSSRSSVLAQWDFSRKQRDERNTIRKQQARMDVSHREKMLQEY